MTVPTPLHQALASDDPAERRDGLLQLSLLLGDRITQLQGIRRQVDLAMQQMDRNLGKKRPNGRRAEEIRHLTSTPSTIESIEALIGSA